MSKQGRGRPQNLLRPMVRMALAANPGETDGSIASRIGVSKGTVRNIRREIGVPPLPLGRPPGVGVGPRDTQRYDAIMQAVRFGESLRVIGDRFGISYQRVSQIKNRYTSP